MHRNCTYFESLSVKTRAANPGTQMSLEWGFGYPGKVQSKWAKLNRWHYWDVDSARYG